MIKTLLCCSLLVGGAQAMKVGPTFYDNSFDPTIIINLLFLKSEFVDPEQTTAENGHLLKELEEEDSKFLAMLKELEKKELQDKTKDSEE